MTKTEPGAFSVEFIDRGLISATQLKFMGKDIYDVACHETMGMWFERLGHLELPLTPAALSARLNEGLESLEDDVIDTVKPLLPKGDYLVGLFYVLPKPFEDLHPQRSVEPGPPESGSSDRVWVTRFSTFNALRGSHRPLDEVPEAERTRESRSFPGHVEVVEICTGYEFVRPLIDLTSLSEEHVRKCRGWHLVKGTALALSVYCGCRPGGGRPEEILTHFLLDGHHKMAHACRFQKPVAILSFLKEDWFGVPVRLAEDSIRKESEYQTNLSQCRDL